MGKIIHGNKNFGFAPIIDNDGVKSFGTPVMIQGMVSSSIEVEQEDTKIYADDVEYCVVKGAKARSATVNFRNIPAAYASFLGFKESENGGFTDTGLFPTHCIFFETQEEDCETGTSQPTIHYLYAVKASEPSKESQTDEESVEALEIEVKYTAAASSFVFDTDNEAVQYYYLTRTAENAELYDSFKSAVILPNSQAPTPPTPTYHYEEVTPVGTENPSEEGWYEYVNDEYVPTEDTTVDDQKTYYQRVED